MAQKKSFKENLTPAFNPVMQFISTPETAAEAEPSIEQPTKQATSTPAGYKPNPMFIETKSKRLQLLLQPSLLEKVRAKAKREGLSVNELVHSILLEATKGEE